MNIVNLQESGIAPLMSAEITELRETIKALEYENADLKKNNLLLGGALQEIKKQRNRLEEQQARILHELSEALSEIERYRRILEMTLPYVKPIGPVARAIENVLNETMEMETT